MLSQIQAWFRKLVGLKKYHHFTFFNSGEVQSQLIWDSDPQVTNLLKGPDRPDDDIAPIIKSPGLSQQRADYLFNEIREFVAIEHQDIVCPCPPASQQSPSASMNKCAASITASASSPVASSSSTPSVPRKVGRPKKSPRALATKKGAKQ